jgi:hypothetical protein
MPTSRSKYSVKKQKPIKVTQGYAKVRCHIHVTTRLKSKDDIKAQDIITNQKLRNITTPK